MLYRYFGFLAGCNPTPNPHSHQLKGFGEVKALIISRIYHKKSTGLRIFMVTKP
jgi:hypothetical protein